MSIGINRVTLAGYLGRDPEITKTRDGGMMAVLSLATTDHWTDRKSGETRAATEWHRVVVWAPHLVRLAGARLRTGSAVYVEGRLESRVWSDGEGRQRHVTEVVLRGVRGEMRLLDRAPRGGTGGGERAPTVDHAAPAPNGQARPGQGQRQGQARSSRRVHDDPNAPPEHWPTSGPTPGSSSGGGA